MDKSKSNEETPANSLNGPSDKIITHQQKKGSDSADPSTLKISPGVPTEVVGNPVDPGINPAKLVGQPKQSKKKKQAAQKKVGHGNKKYQEVSHSVSRKEHKTAPLTDSQHMIQMAYKENNKVKEKTQSEQSAQDDNIMPPPNSQIQGVMAAQNQAGRWMVGLASIISVCSLAVALMSSYWVFGMQDKLSQVNLTVTQDETLVKGFVDEANHKLSALTQLQQHSQKQQDTLNQLKSEILQAQSQLMHLSGKKEWVLNEVYFLLQNADTQLKINHDIKTAIAQLGVADNKLKSLGMPQLMWLRKEIAKDIAALETAPVLDKHGVWAKLSAVDSQIYHLKFKPVIDAPDSATSETASSQPNEGQESSWKKAALDSWSEFKSLIRVSRYDQDVLTPVLTTLEQGQLLRSLALMIDQAQWAVLKEDSIVFHQSLGKVQSLVNQYFEPTSPREHLLENIQDLSKISLRQASLDISGSLSALENAINQNDDHTSKTVERTS